MTSSTPLEPGGPGSVGGAESTAARLRAMLAEGRLTPGTRLSEERLSESIGVSRNTLREAFRLLSHERLVEHRFNRGVFVRTLTPSDVSDVFTARQIIEGAAVRACLPRSAALSGADAAVAEARAAASEGDWARVGSANVRFHASLVSALPSDRLTTLMEALMAEMRLAFHAVGDPAAFHGPYIDRNADLVRLLRAGDREGAATALAAYLEGAEAELVEAASGASGAGEAAGARS